MRILKLISIFGAGALVLCAFALFLFVKGKQPTRDGSLALPGLSAPVEVFFDPYGVPHIYAQNEGDAYRALGYLHAQDRLFQMEMLRRLSRGRLAEILGPKLVKIDSFFRTLRFAPTAREMLARLPRDSGAYRSLEAYLAGVNHFIKTGPAPLEFHILGIEKQEYTAEDTICVLGYMAYSFAAGFKLEPLLTHVHDSLGPGYLNDLQTGLVPGPPRNMAGNAPSPGSHAKSEQVAFLRGMLEIRNRIERFAEPIGLPTGSNAWVVAGRRSASGAPLLASDPHIAFAQPSVWYEAHLVTPDWEIYGHHLAIVPTAVLGHNRDYGWGITMFKNDDTDFYRERPDPERPDHVLFRGKSEALLVENEIIKVKGEADVPLKVRRSRHGPIVSQATENALKVKYPPAPVALAWPLYDKSNDPLIAFYRMNRAKSMKEFAAALEHIAAPGLNFIYGDREGNIGWWAAARIPERPKHVNPALILDGASGRDEWRGFRPFSKNPQSTNPPSGIIVSANHQPASEPPVPGYYNPFHRALAIRGRLKEKPGGWTPQDFREMQTYARMQYHRPLRALAILELKDDPEITGDETAARALEIFAEWPGDHDLESAGPAIFYRFFFEMTRLTFADELGADFFKAFQSAVWVDTSMSKVAGRVDSPWWDDTATAERETRAMIVKRAFQRTVSNLRERFGDDPGDWHWSKVHELEHVHAIGRKKPFHLLFNVGPFPVRGGREIVHNMKFTINADEPYRIRTGPSTRRVIDFAAPGDSTGILPTGQSGVVFDRHYDDQAKMFARGESRPQLMDRERIEKSARSRLLLDVADH